MKKKCEHGRERYYCKDCGGSGICKHGRQRSICKDCGGSSICEHGRERSRCKECGGGSICEHGRERSRCKDCGGSKICEHGRQRRICKDCGGSGICEHGRRRTQCKKERKRVSRSSRPRPPLLQRCSEERYDRGVSQARPQCPLCSFDSALPASACTGASSAKATHEGWLQPPAPERPVPSMSDEVRARTSNRVPAEA